MSTIEAIQTAEPTEETIEEIVTTPVDEGVGDNCSAILRVTPNGIKTEFLNKNGNKTYKNISVSSLARVLNRDQEFDTGFLPIFGQNYIGIKRYIKLGDKDILFIEASPANRNIKWRRENNILENVRYPGLLMAVVCITENNGQMNCKNTRLFATRNPILRETDRLYHFPFGNVYADGRVCWGSTNINNFDTLTKAGGMLELFLSSVMNNDLYSYGIIHRSLEGWLTNLSNESDFPYSDLRQSDLTFRDLTSLLKNKNVR